MHETVLVSERSLDGGDSILPRAARARLAGLAFGSGSARASAAVSSAGLDLGKHLAFLPEEALDLDLSDPAQRRFGDYELLELIGQGGMGVVYRARQVSLDREVAVKLLSAGPWASRDFIERFQSEAQNAARMQHPNIVPIHEVGAVEGLHFFSMRLVRGTSLGQQIRYGPLPTHQRAAALLRTIAEAVDYAHRLGVLHLDLKPANVLMDEAGEPHVADFGLARRIDQSAAEDRTEISGTPSYMSPEQATPGRAITSAADIWGLGAIGYELVTGHVPFEGDTAHAVLNLVVQGNLRRPREAVPLLSRDFEAIILKCMARDPLDRYRSARELADDLGRLLDNRPVRARPLNRAQRVMRWARRQPYVAAFATLFVVSLITGMVGVSAQWRRAEANSAIAHKQLWDSREADALRLMESGDGWNAAPLLLANLRDMTMQGAADRVAGARKRLGLIVNNNPRVIDAWNVGQSSSLAFTPDGKQLAVSKNASGIRVFDVESGKPAFGLDGEEGASLLEWNTFEYLRFAADGRTLLATGAGAKENAPHPTASSMQRLDLEKRTWIARPPEFGGFIDASYSFDGRYAVLTNKAGRAQFWATDPWRPLSPLRDPPPLNGPPFRLVAPDGTLFAQDAQAHAIVLVDARTLAVRARVELDGFANLAAWTFSPDARWLALGDDAGVVVVVDCRTFAVRRPEPRSYFPINSIEFSADGGWLIAAANSGGIYLWDWPAGRLLAPPFGGGGSASQPGDPRETLVDRARGLVLGSDDTDAAALWQIAPAPLASDRAEAVQITARINASRNYQVEQIAWDKAHALLAVRSVERVRLERLPPLALKHGRAAPQMPGTLRFDGRRLVEVDGNVVQIVDASLEQAAGARVEFSQPADFAELAADGATLVVVVGRMLHVLDAASGAERFAPIALDNSPSHVELSPDGKRLVAMSVRVDTDGDRNQSGMTVMYDLGNGELLGGPYPLMARARDIFFSADGRRLLAWNRFELTLRDGSNLAPIPGQLALFRPRGTNDDGDKPWMQVARFDASGDVEAGFGTEDHGAFHWELRTYGAGDSVRVRPMPQVFPREILPLPGHAGTVLAGMQGGTSIIGADGSFEDLDDFGDDTRRYCFAVSPDGRWLARARRDGVALWDLHGRARIATLRAAVPRPDLIWQLAFAGDGNRLLARTLDGRMLVWDLSSDLRGTDAIARALDLRDLSTVRTGIPLASPEPDAAERAALRAGDPGPPPGPPSAPATVAPVRELPGGGVPPRNADAPAATLDLTRWYTFGLREPLPSLEDGGAEFRWLPQGLQRFLGVDYDIRGGVSLHAPLQARFDVGRAVGAIDVLVLTDASINAPGKDHLADARLEFADGSSATLPVGLLRDSYYEFRDPAKPPPALFAAWGWDARTVSSGGVHDFAFVARVVNPRPQRPVATLTLSAPGNVGVQASILAVSLEPAGALADAR